MFDRFDLHVKWRSSPPTKKESNRRPAIGRVSGSLLTRENVCGCGWMGACVRACGKVFARLVREYGLSLVPLWCSWLASMPSKRWTRVRVPQEVAADVLSFSPRGVKEAYGIPNLMVRVRFPAWSVKRAESRLPQRQHFFLFLLSFVCLCFCVGACSGDDHVSDTVCDATLR